MFPTDNIQLGPHTYGRRPKTYGVVLHTTEGPNSSMAAAKGTATWQSPGGGGWAGGGSYNFILTDDGPLLTVPYLEAAGGLSGTHDPAWWRPDRFPWLKQSLPAVAYNDPNLYMLQLSVSGKTSQLQSYPRIHRIAEDAAKIIKWAEDSDWAENNLVVSGHFNWQTDRSDPSQWFVDLVMEKYMALVTPQPPIQPADERPVFVPEQWTDSAGNLVTTVAESFDGGMRLKLNGNRLEWVGRKSLVPVVQGGDPVYRQNVLDALAGRSTGDDDSEWLAWLAKAPTKD